MLKRSATGIVLVLSAFAAGTSLYAQADPPTAAGADLPPCFSSLIDGREAKWFRHEFGAISICLPEVLIRRKTDRCGSGCYIHESGELFFDADLTASAWRPTFEKKYPSYSATSRLIDGKSSTVWYFEDTGKYKYVAGVNVIFERGTIGMGVYLFSKTSDPKPIAERMFNSIRFTKPVYN
jgi:hypothetical protein